MTRPVRTDANEAVEADLITGMWDCCGRTIAPSRPLLLDGPNRDEIGERHQIHDEIEEWEDLHTRDEVINWIVDNQLGRRNLSPKQKMYLRGRRFRIERPPEGYNQHGGEGSEVPPSKTKEELAAEYGVTPDTIKRDRQFAEAIDTIEQTAEAKQPGAAI